MNGNNNEPLQSLKQILQEHLEVWQGRPDKSDDYKEALEDCIYSCDLSVIALEQHLDCWLTVCPIDSKYRNGVQFVNDQWNIIKEKENEIY